jgi:hypothetical protein
LRSNGRVFYLLPETSTFKQTAPLYPELSKAPGGIAQTLPRLLSKSSLQTNRGETPKRAATSSMLNLVIHLVSSWKSKKASPSAGVIAESFNPVKIA